MEVLSTMDDDVFIADDLEAFETGGTDIHIKDDDLEAFVTGGTDFLIDDEIKKAEKELTR